MAPRQTRRKAAEATRSRGKDDGQDRSTTDRAGEYFHRMLEKLPAAAYICSAEGLITHFNKRAVQLWGRAPRLNDPVDRYCGSFRLFSPDGTPVAHDECWMALALRHNQEYNEREILIERPDGSRAKVLAHANPIQDDAGRLIGAANILVDITDLARVAYERAHLAAIIDSADDAIISKSLDGVIQSWNRAAERIFGYTAAEAIGRSVSMLIPPDRQSEERDILDRVKRGERVQHYETVRMRKDGALLDTSLTVSPIRDAHGAVIGASKIARNISARKQAETALRESESRFRNLAEGMPHMVWESDPGGRFHYKNQVWYDYIGQPPGSSHGEDWLHSYHPDDREHLLTEWTKSLRSEGGHLYDIEVRIRRHDGVYRWFRVKGAPVRNEAGGIARWVGTCTDIDNHKRAEQAVAQLNRDLTRRIDELQALLNVAPIGIAVASDSECRHITVNRAGAAMLGTPNDENISKSRADAARLPFRVLRDGRELRPEELPMQYAAHHNLAVRDLELDIVWDNGTRRTLLEYASPVRDDQGQVRGCVGIFVDVTERRKMEEDLLRAQKLESIGTLAGGIAHDFNNILTAVFGNIELAKLYADGQDHIVEPLTQAEKAFRRARDLTHQLLTFSRGGAPIRRVASVAELLRESVAFALHGSRVRVEFNVSPELCPANIDVGQIGQVINNLVINAKDAMPGGGRLCVEAKNAVIETENGSGLRPGRYVEIRIKDWGIGVSAENLPKLFDPYFTTKPHGTGLGLSTVYSILHRHGGDISVRSTPGKGTTFCFYLPASDQSLSQPAEPVRVLPRGNGRILLMDDDDGVRRIGKTLLERLGYVVEMAPEGREAIALFRAARERGDHFFAVILDLTIPAGMGGRECLERLREIDPDVRALVSSGYFNDPVMSEYATYGFRGVVPKPYQLADLNEALSKLATASGESNG